MVKSTPDITNTDFHDWVEIASRDKTCGWIFPADLWVDQQGVAHILWAERATDLRLRDKFFPDVKQTHALNYALVRDGEVVERHELVLGGEDASSEVASRGRFHVTPDNRLFVIYYVNGTDGDGKPVSENRLLELLPDGQQSAHVRVPMKHPMTSFFTATPRAGSPPSDTLELLGTRVGGGSAISYARIRLK